jgi:hypothetical protein
MTTPIGGLREQQGFFGATLFIFWQIISSFDPTTNVLRGLSTNGGEQLKCCELMRSRPLLRRQCRPALSTFNKGRVSPISSFRRRIIASRKEGGMVEAAPIPTDNFSRARLQTILQSRKNQLKLDIEISRP